jgi:hypothetical protein
MQSICTARDDKISCTHDAYILILAQPLNQGMLLACEGNIAVWKLFPLYDALRDHHS